MKLREYMKRTPQLGNWKPNNFRIIPTNAPTSTTHFLLSTQPILVTGES